MICDIPDLMPEAILKFDLPDEDEEFRTACQAPRIRHTLWELDQWLRTKLKYEDWPEDKQDIYDAYELCRTQLYELLDENGVDLDDRL